MKKLSVNTEKLKGKSLLDAADAVLEKDSVDIVNFDDVDIAYDLSILDAAEKVLKKDIDDAVGDKPVKLRKVKAKKKEIQSSLQLSIFDLDPSLADIGIDTSDVGGDKFVLTKGSETAIEPGPNFSLKQMLEDVPALEPYAVLKIPKSLSPDDENIQRAVSLGHLQISTQNFVQTKKNKTAVSSFAWDEAEEV